MKRAPTSLADNMIVGLSVAHQLVILITVLHLASNSKWPPCKWLWLRLFLLQSDSCSAECLEPFDLCTRITTLMVHNLFVPTLTLSACIASPEVHKFYDSRKVSDFLRAAARMMRASRPSSEMWAMKCIRTSR